MAQNLELDTYSETIDFQNVLAFLSNESAHMQSFALLIFASAGSVAQVVSIALSAMLAYIGIDSS